MSALWECGTCKTREPFNERAFHTCRPSDLLKAAAAIYRERDFPGDKEVADWLTAQALLVSHVDEMDEVDDGDEPGGGVGAALAVAQRVMAVSW